MTGYSTWTFLLNWNMKKDIDPTQLAGLGLLMCIINNYWENPFQGSAAKKLKLYVDTFTTDYEIWNSFCPRLHLIPRVDLHTKKTNAYHMAWYNNCSLLIFFPLWLTMYPNGIVYPSMNYLWVYGVASTRKTVSSQRLGVLFKRSVTNTKVLTSLADHKRIEVVVK